MTVLKGLIIKCTNVLHSGLVTGDLPGEHHDRREESHSHTCRNNFCSGHNPSGISYASMVLRGSHAARRAFTTAFVSTSPSSGMWPRKKGKWEEKLMTVIPTTAPVAVSKRRRKSSSSSTVFARRGRAK